MPEESIAAYINNTITFVIYILICIIVFALAYFISVNIRKKVLSRNKETSHIDIDVDNRGTGFKEKELRKGQLPIKASDPFMRKNIALLGFIFVFMILLVVLALAVFYYSWNMGINNGLYMIGAVFLGFVVLLIFISRSGTINK
jgi:Na+/melibiose symporter-like transporter